jgi:hypothetical protein
LIQRISRAFGAVASSSAGSNAELEGLLDLLSATKPGETVPLIVIDGVVAGTPAATDAALLGRAARSTRYFSLVVVGPAALAEELGDDDPASSLVRVPPLALRQVAAYFDAWLDATRIGDAPPLIVSVDAALLAGHRAEGNLRRINAIARQMIAGGGRILTSWDAWSVPETEDDGPRPARPALWPTSAAMKLINRCRIAAGLPERGAPS